MDNHLSALVSNVDVSENKFSERTHFRLLLYKDSRQRIRIVLLGLYFVVFQLLLLVQKPFLQPHFAMTFHFVFAALFLHHMLLQVIVKPDYSENISFSSYAFDIVVMIIFMRFFPQLSSFLLVLQLFFLFLASFDLSFFKLSSLGFLSSLCISLLSISTAGAVQTQNVLSLILFNLSYLAIIVIAGQLRTEISGLEQGLALVRKKWKSQAEFAKSMVEKMPLGLIVSQDSNQEILIENNFLLNHLNFSKIETENIIKEINQSSNQTDITIIRSPRLEKRTYSFDRTSYYDEELQEKINIDLLKDVTDMRLLQERLKQKEKLAAIGQLAAGIAHEIRNPLAGISGSIQLLSTDKIDPDQQKLMKIILKEIDRLNNLITEFLDYAKPEKKPDQVIDLSLVLEDVVQNLKRHPDSGLEATWDVQLTSQKILGFSEKLKQCFLNIILNSLQAMKSIAQPKLQIVLSDAQDYSQVLIKDNGNGMNEEIQKRIFEPFYTTKSKGTGLGLALTHKILESHSAIINVSSEINKGTEFTIRFPKSNRS